MSFRYTILTTFILLLYTGDLNAQWLIKIDAKEPGETQNCFSELDCTDDRNCIAIGFILPSDFPGYLYGVWRTTDAGTTWTAQNLPINPTSLWPIARLRDVDMFDSLHATIVGDSGLIFSTTNGGESWQHLDTMRIWGYRDVSMISPHETIAVGTHGKIIVTKDGKNWDEISGPTNYLLDFVIAHPNNRINIISQFFGKQYTTTDWGLSWDSVRLFTDYFVGDTGKYLYDASLLNGDTAFVVGGNRKKNPAQEHLFVMRTTDAGRSWAALFDEVMGVGLYGKSIDFLDASRGLVGLSNDNVAFTSDGGSMWTKEHISVGKSVGEVNGVELLPTRSILTSSIVGMAGYLITREHQAHTYHNTLANNSIEVGNGYLTVHVSGALEVTDILGRAIYQSVLNAGEEIDLRSLSSSPELMLVRFVSNSGNVHTLKLRRL